MLTIPELSLWFGATLLLCVSPGPNVFTTLSFALAEGWAPAMRSVCGVAVASAVYLLVSALGLVAALTAAASAFFVVRMAGAVYLAYLGARMLRAAARPIEPTAPPIRLTGRPFTQGFVTHISNPKALLYWGALLPQFIDANRRIAGQIVLLGSLGILVDVTVLASYAALAAFARRKIERPGVLRSLHGVAGVFFVASSLWLAVMAGRP